MKRKYPFSFFLFGVFQNLLRYIVIGLVGLILLIIGILSVSVCKIVGMAVLVCYLLLCVIRQLWIRSISIKESDNPDFNEFMDSAFEDPGHGGTSSRQEIIQMVEDRIKSQDADTDN